MSQPGLVSLPRGTTCQSKTAWIASFFLLLTGWVGVLHHNAWVNSAGGLASLLVLGLGLFALFRRRIRLGLVLLTINSPFFSYVHGFRQWWTDDPSYAHTGKGHLTTEGRNPHRTTRCPTREGVHAAEGKPWIWPRARNAGLHTAGLLLGPPNGAYTGPYPTREEALSALVQGQPVRLAEFAGDQVLILGKSHPLDRGIGRSLLGKFLALPPSYWDREIPLPEPACRIIAVLHQDECLILRMRSKFAEITDCVVLLDRKNGRPFACYLMESPSSYPLPIPYRR